MDMNYILALAYEGLLVYITKKLLETRSFSFNLTLTRCNNLKLKELCRLKRKDQ